MLLVEELTSSLNNFGLLQKRALIFLFISSLVAGSQMVFHSVFVVYTPPHRCCIPSLDEMARNNHGNFCAVSNKLEIVSKQSNTSYFVPIEKNSNEELAWSKCLRFDNFIEEENTSSTNQSAIHCDHGWKYFEDPGVLSAVMEFDLVCEDAWKAPLSTSMIMFGYMGGSIFGSLFSDRFGRKIALLLGFIIQSLSFIVLGFNQIWTLVYFLCFTGGWGNITRTVTGTVLVNELTPNKHRHFAGFIYQMCATFGYMLLPFAAYCLPNWRYMVITISCIQLLNCITLYLFVPESIKWLIENKKNAEVKQWLRKIEKVNKVELPDIDIIKSTENIDLQGLTEEIATSKARYSYLDLFKHSFLRTRIAIFGFAWFSVVFAYFGLSLNTNNLGWNRYISCLVAGAVEIPGNILNIIAMRKIGGRLSFVIMTGFAGLCLLFIPLLQKVNQWAALVCTFIGKLSISGSFANIYIFTGDLFPTLLRNQSYGACSFIARWSGILTPFVLYLGENYYSFIPYLLTGSFALLSAVAMYFLPETHKKPLPNTLEEAKDQETLKRICCGNTKSDDNTDTTSEA